jgi:hypothetical protein
VAFLKADVDLRLLLILMLVLVVFVGSTAYYQSRMAEMQANYDEKVAHLKDIEAKLILKEEKLNQIAELSESLQKDKEFLEIGYITLQNEKQEQRVVENTPVVEHSKTIPFSKTLCKITGNVQCIN